MTPDTANDVAGAFDVMLQEIEAQIGLTEQTGAQAITQHNYERARQVLERAGQFAAIREKILALRLDWEELLGFREVAPPEEDQELKEPTPLEAFRTACLARIEKELKTRLVRKRATSYVSADGKLAVICAVSRAYEHAEEPRYWFAFHTSQEAFLKACPEAYVAFACGSADQLLLIPFGEFHRWLETLNITARKGGVYWHVHLIKLAQGFVLERKKEHGRLDVSEYLVP